MKKNCFLKEKEVLGLHLFFHMVTLPFIFLIWGIFFYVIMPDNVRYAMNFTFIGLIFYPVFFYLSSFRMERNGTTFCTKLLIVCYVIFGIGIWLGIFFGCFYNNLSYSYEKATECRITSKKSTAIPNMKDLEE